MPQLDANFFPPQLIWLAITFVALYLLMARVALPRIGRVLEQRQKKIDDNLDKAELLKVESDKDAKTYEKSLGESRDQARALVQEVSRRASAEATKRQAVLAEKLASRIKEADAHILEAKREALVDVRASAVSVAQLAVRRLVDVEPSAQSVSSAIEAVMRERS